MKGEIVFPESGSLLKIVKSRYATLEQARRALPSFSGVRVVDPQLVNPAGDDYRLKPTSPAINAGVLIPGINDVGFAGKAPDIGAFEHRGQPAGRPRR